MAYELVVLGASWGGLDALSVVLAGLPPGFGAAVAVAQHRRGGSEEGLLASLLGAVCPLPVADAVDKQPLEPGRVVLAPADYHLLVERGYYALSTDAVVRFSRPSVDVLFESAADAYGERAIGVVLTGSNDDGARGLARIKARGGYAIVQEPATAARPEMPSAALAAAEVDEVLPLELIAPALRRPCPNPAQ